MNELQEVAYYSGWVILHILHCYLSVINPVIFIKSMIFGIRKTRPQNKSPPVQPKTTRPQLGITRHHSTQFAPNIKTLLILYFHLSKDKIAKIIYFPCITEQFILFLKFCVLRLNNMFLLFIKPCSWYKFRQINIFLCGNQQEWWTA